MTFFGFNENFGALLLLQLFEWAMKKKKKCISPLFVGPHTTLTANYTNFSLIPRLYISDNRGRY